MPAYLPRPGLSALVRRVIRRFRVTVLLGPRQCGKTTLARQVAGTAATYFDLEDPTTPLRPDIAKQVLDPIRGLVTIDEFQCQPHLFKFLRVLADRRPRRARFLILGSSSPALVRGASETLAGRVRAGESARRSGCRSASSCESVSVPEPFTGST